jgi:hypothetical protein
MQINESLVSQAKNLGLPPSESGIQTENDFLLNLKPFLCKGAVVEFAQCLSGRNAPNMTQCLQETFGSDTKVILQDK